MPAPICAVVAPLAGRVLGAALVATLGGLDLLSASGQAQTSTTRLTDDLGWFAFVTLPLRGAQGRQPVQAPAAPVTAPDPSTGAITGVVIDDAGTPVAEAMVTLWNRTGRGTPQRDRQFTDNQGRFAFVNLAAATGYQVSASSPGFRDGGIGRPTAWEDFGALVPLEPGQWVAKARITLTRLATVTGTVLDDRGDPLVGAYVRAIGKLTIAGRPYLVAGSHTTTDDRGWYRLADLIPGPYLIQVPSVTGSAPADVSAIALAGGSPQALARYQASGQTPPVELTTPLDAAWQVQVGRYATPPAPVEGRWRVFPITFFPATSDVTQATVIDARAGLERTADIRVMPVSTGRVSGTVQGSAEALADLTVRLVPAGLEDLGLGNEAATSLVRPDGSFVFVGVPAGSYFVDTTRLVAEFTSRPMAVTTRVTDTVMPPPIGPTGLSWTRTGAGGGAPPGVDFVFRETRSGAGGFGGRTPLVTDGSDASGVVVTMRELATLSGDVLVDPDAAPTPARVSYVSVMLDAADGDPKLGRPEARVNLNAGSAFTITEAMPGEYFLRPVPSGGWMVKSVTWRGRDVTDVALDLASTRQVSDVTVTLTNAVPTLSGVVRTESGLSAEGAAVIVFPVAPSGWTRFGLMPRGIKTVAASTTGAFEFKTLPAGDYFAVAVPEAQRWAWHEPGFFQRMSAVATRVRLSWGETTTQALPLVAEVRR